MRPLRLAPRAPSPSVRQPAAPGTARARRGAWSTPPAMLCDWRSPRLPPRPRSCSLTRANPLLSGLCLRLRYALRLCRHGIPPTKENEPQFRGITASLPVRVPWFVLVLRVGPPTPRGERDGHRAVSGMWRHPEKRFGADQAPPEWCRGRIMIREEWRRRSRSRGKMAAPEIKCAIYRRSRRVWEHAFDFCVPLVVRTTT